MLNLSLILEQSARRYPDKPAFTFMDTQLSFRQTNDQANKVANGLRSIGIRPGDKVALTCPNLPAFPVLYYGIIRAGAVVMPLSVLLKKDEIEYQLRDCEAKAYFCFAGTPELPMGEMGYAAFKCVDQCEHFFMIMPKPGMPAPIEGAKTYDVLIQDQPTGTEIHPTGAEDTCVIIYTSGTTGRPKGAELTHFNLWFIATVFADIFKSNHTDDTLLVLPLFHIFGMAVMMNTSVYRGCSNVLLPPFDASAVLSALQKHNVTIFGGVPTMYWALLNCRLPEVDDQVISKNLKVCVCGGASLPSKVIEEFEKRFDVPILEGYGMSESTCAVTFNQLEIGRKAGSVGTPLPNVQIKLVDSNGDEVPAGEKGELLYRGPNLMKGYYKKPAETAKALEGGWMHSGDIAVKDEEGFFYIVDRTKDMIIRGGMKVYPREVEEVMIKHEAVSLVAIIGISHEEVGEEVKAFVVLKENVQVSEGDLIHWTKERVASFKYPRHIEFITAMPMSATGKILKKELRK